MGIRLHRNTSVPKPSTVKPGDNADTAVTEQSGVKTDGAVGRPSDKQPPKVVANEASAQARAVIGDTGAGPTPRKKSAGARGALAGLQAADEAPKKSGTPRWKKAVLGAMIGIMSLNMLAPTVAAAQDFSAANLEPTTRMEQVLSQDELPSGSPLMMQLASKSISVDTGLEEAAPGPSGIAGDTIQTAGDADDPGPQIGDRLAELNAQINGDEVAASDLSPAVQKMVEQANARFGDRVEDILNRDAGSLAAGQTPWQPGDQLTAQQEGQLKDALTDMFKELPAGALSESLTGPLQTLLANNGVDVSNFETTKLGDLGDYGGDLAKNLVDQLKDNHPVAFYATAGVAAAGVGYLAYDQGSEALRDLGIKPEFSTDLFGDRLEVSVGADWESGFKEFSGTVDGTWNFDNGHSVGAGVRWDGENVSPRLSYGFDGQQWDAKVNTEFNTGTGDVNTDGFVNYRPNQDLNLRLSGELDADGPDQLRFDVKSTLNNDSTLNLGVRQIWDDNGVDRTDVNARWSLSRDDWSASAGAFYRFDGDATYGADVRLGYQPRDNLDIQFRGSVDNQGNAQAGVGVVFSW